jgi:hypothetical protein
MDHISVKGSELRIDPDAQRLFEQHRANKIAEEWDERSVGAITVSLRDDGGMYILDGMHRVAAGLLVDPDMMFFCIIHKNMSAEDEATLFLRSNNERKSVNRFDTYRMYLRANDEVALRIQAEVMAAGLSVGRRASTNQVSAVVTLRRWAEKDVPPYGLITRALNINEVAWGRTAEAWDNTVIAAVCEVLHKNPHIQINRLVHTLQKFVVAQWAAKGVERIGGSGGSASRPSSTAACICDEYNKRLSLAKRIGL